MLENPANPALLYVEEGVTIVAEVVYRVAGFSNPGT
jgi:hypothetical protein